jgi:cytochrome c biogenesis protein CcdA/thiol-disulfide isomerase/thioredoxin
MTLLVLSYLGGVLTILSPCVLPILPFVFSRAGQSFTRSTLPLLAGIAITFTALASLATVGGARIIAANEYGRIAAVVVLAAFGLMLLWPELADRVMTPIVGLGNRLSEGARTGTGKSAVGSMVIGVATGFLWAPCAGPILGLILTGAALQGANARTALLLLSYAAGAATSLALALLLGGRVFTALKRSLGAGEWLRRGLGAAVLTAVAVIALGLDTTVLTRWSLANTTRLEQTLVDRLRPATAMKGGATANGLAPHAPTITSTASPPDEGPCPPLTGAVYWVNTPPLTPGGLRGKVALIDFWTYSCINCLRTLPYVRAWADKYRDHGLVVIGVHTPEFAFEKSLDNVRQAVHRLHITYPVAVDNDYAIWGAFFNEYWPAHYFIDAKGRIRGHQFGEGDYESSERMIQRLLSDAGYRDVPTDLVSVRGSGVEAAQSGEEARSSETYVGYARAQNFKSKDALIADRPASYRVPTSLQLDQWGLDGRWTVESEKATLQQAGGRIVFRFHARDLHLVLGPAAGGAGIRFRVTIDGAEPGADHGLDTNARGDGTVREQRLYQLIRQSGEVRDRTFTIEFLDAGVQAFSFTFG